MFNRLVAANLQYIETVAESIAMVGFLMLSVLLFSAVRQDVPNSSSASMVCSTAPESKVQMSGVHGPDGSVFALAITSDDDHSKNSHQCESAYSLLVTLSGEPARSIDLGFGTVDRYGRRLEIRAEGFSPDGDRFFGLACESNVLVKGEPRKKSYRGADATLIDYQITSRQTSIFDLSPLIPYTLGCGSDVIQVLGVTSNSEPVLALKDGKLIRKWAIELESKNVWQLSKDMSFLPLNRAH
jgi:hypothetical protein